jgi:hypothetical protein
MAYRFPQRRIWPMYESATIRPELGARTSNASAFSDPVNASRRPDAGCLGLAFSRFVVGWIIWHSQSCFGDCLEEG